MNVCMYVSVTGLRLKYTDFFVLRHLVNVTPCMTEKRRQDDRKLEG